MSARITLRDGEHAIVAIEGRSDVVAVCPLGARECSPGAAEAWLGSRTPEGRSRAWELLGRGSAVSGIEAVREREERLRAAVELVHQVVRAPLASDRAPVTLSDVLAGWLPEGHRDPACIYIWHLWEALGVADATPIEELRAWWTPERACEIARFDGAGPGIRAVAWICAALGDVLAGADLRDADLYHANLAGVNLAGANLDGADLSWSGALVVDADLTGAYRPRGWWAPPGWTRDAGGRLRAEEVA